MARGEAFSEVEPAHAFARELAASGTGVVVKADGLAGGKGVRVCSTIEEADAAIGRIFANPGGDTGAARVVVEERLVGREASVIAVCDGRDAIGLPPARDYKRLLDGDEGPNTGGMGAYSPLPDLPDSMLEELLDAIHRPILAELAKRGTPFRGALYAGLILAPGGPRLLECNARFGDPETQVVMPRVGVALGPLLLAAARGELAAASKQLGLTGSHLPPRLDTAVAVVLATAGYPDEPRPGDRIEGLEFARMRGAIVFHAGTARDEDGAWRTAGGRVVTLVARAADLETARDLVEDAAAAVSWPGLQRRRDIAVERPVSSDTRTIADGIVE
jgi:phosphoribosylamine--glycine ligase